MSTNPKIIFIVVCGLLAFAMTGLIGTFYLITIHAEGAMIAIISGPTVTALGGVMAMLNNTRTTATNGKPNGQPEPPK